jgi:hypothetical protein
MELTDVSVGTELNGLKSVSNGGYFEPSSFLKGSE